MFKGIFYNEKIINSFTDDEKEKFFSEIAEMYLYRNFGSVSKVDFETYIFSFYLEHLINNNYDFDDYILGRDLGLTQSRIRTLKERKELKYPHVGYEWWKNFLEYAQNAKYDDTKKLIKFSIPDVNVLKDVRYFLRKHNQYDEYQLNPSLFQCRLDTFIDIVKLITEENDEEFDLRFENKDKLNKILKEEICSSKETNCIKKIINGAVEEGVKELLVFGGKEICYEVISCINPGVGFTAKILSMLKNILK